ncbi:CoA transferase [Ancylobacter sonchi]|uniref:CaiB/BaiF CoA transferase family protein n=1 Tax=Ancylobacter sonchi TaxID=1937790 RepID=UPI001BD5B85D|nr:CaiB/BaiF CoA-transferase family protein [Ancylobacter sonchi]MBS7532489.1 CoA transferase [Ancylobacter sonchi]
MTEPAALKPGALEGLRVLDLTRVLAGPQCAMLLGDLGADVIKVERPGAGDDTRAWGPPYHGTEAAYFLCTNRNKRGITLDLKAPEAREILRDLIRQSDVVIENFKAGTLEAMGCGEAFFREEAPNTILCTISGYTGKGPRANMPGYDFLLQAESGLMSITGEVGGDPTKLGVAIVDICTGLYAAIAILGALQARERGEGGQHVEVSLYTTAIALLANVASNVLVSGKDAGRYGNGHPNIVPYRSFRCADADIALAVGNDSQFARFAAVAGHAEWSADDRFARNSERVRNRAALDALIENVMLARLADSWIADLQAAGIPCGRINSVAEALAAEQSVATGMVLDVMHNTAGAFRSIGIPMQLSRTPARLRRPPPSLGEHTDSVLAQVLGMSEERIDALRTKGVV